MGSRGTYDVSVILPFRDDEDVIGTAIKRIANHLRELGASFEILAIDEDSGDNSHAVLALLRTHFPELRVSQAEALGRGFDAGARRAQGHTLWLIEPAHALAPLAPFTRAHQQVLAGELDAVVVRHRFVVAHRVPVLESLTGLKGRGPAFQRRFARRALLAGLRIDNQSLGGGAVAPRPIAERPFARLISALSPARRRQTLPPSRLGRL
jgi:glycosyltransferase involved in cell wall biosynthesis